MKSIKLVSAALQKCKSGLPAFGKTTEQPRIIVHIPHSSTNIPKIFQQEFLPGKEKLHSELLCMTDWYTDELFACPGCLAVVHQFSRLHAHVRRRPAKTQSAYFMGRAAGLR